MRRGVDAHSHGYMNTHTASRPYRTRLRCYVVSAILMATGVLSVAPNAQANDGAPFATRGAVLGSGTATNRSASGATPPLTTLLPAPDGQAFFTPPSVIPGRPGDIIWARKSPDPIHDALSLLTPLIAIPSIKKRDGTKSVFEVWQVLYHTTDRLNRSVAVSAMMFFDPARVAGVPVIVAMHGTVGFGDQCGVFGALQRAGLANFYNIYRLLGADDYVFIVPDASGLARTTTPTSVIGVDGSRLLLDASRSATRFTGASNKTLYYGTSFGGTMALGVGAEAPRYAPDVNVIGVVAAATPGMTGIGMPMMDTERNRVSGNSFWYSRTISYMLALEQAYDRPASANAKYLTELGQRIARRMANVCSGDMAQLVVLRSWQDLFKKDPQPLFAIDSGVGASFSSVPTYFLVGNNDSFVDPLMAYHAYRRVCAAGQPAWWQEDNGDHGSVTQEALATPDKPLRIWISQVMAGTPPVSDCQDPSALLIGGYPYTGRYLATGLGVNVPAKHTVTLKADGLCKVKNNVLTTSLWSGAGTCTIAISVKPPKGKSVTTNIVARVRAHP